MHNLSPPHRYASTLIFIVMVVAATILIERGFSSNMKNPTSEVIPMPEPYQSVLLNNKELYIGKLSKKSDKYLLMDVYYIQVSRDAKGNSETKLIKRGNEIHGPEDIMFIPATSIMYWENLRTDGEVAKSIEQSKALREAELAKKTPDKANTSE